VVGAGVVAVGVRAFGVAAVLAGAGRPGPVFGFGRLASTAMGGSEVAGSEDAGGVSPAAGAGLAGGAAGVLSGDGVAGAGA
jgi:hypothetical protein